MIVFYNGYGYIQKFKGFHENNETLQKKTFTKYRGFFYVSDEITVNLDLLNFSDLYFLFFIPDFIPQGFEPEWIVQGFFENSYLIITNENGRATPFNLEHPVITYKQECGNGLRIMSLSEDNEPPTLKIESPQLKILNQAYQHFWSSIQQGDESNYPKNTDVESWLISQGIPKWWAHRLPVILKPKWVK